MGSPAEPERLVLQHHLFKMTGQPVASLGALREDFTFGHAVAKATAFQTAEAKELASLACEILRPLSSRRLIGSSAQDRAIDKLLQNSDTQAIGKLLEWLRKSDEPSDSSQAQKELGERFSTYPQFATELWNEMDWPYPFALILREELRQVAARRGEATAGAAAVEAQAWNLTGEAVG